MVITVYGAWKGHYSKEFKLTMSQRTLMLQTISFMIWMIGGAGVYARIEGWQFLNAVYFTNYTLLTIGVGDYAPMTHLGRSLLFPYAIGGIVMLGLVIGSIRSLVLERGKKKLGSRQVEKMREKMLKMLQKKGQTDKIVPIESKGQAVEVGFSERERRREEFELMRKIQSQAQSRQKWTSLLFSAGAWLFLWLIGALIFYFCEHEQEWSYFGSVYFAYTTLLTIGYGDYKPFSNSGKPFFVFWSLLAVPTLTILISNMGDTVVKSIRDATLYLGEITVLPGEQGTGARFKQLAVKSTGGKLIKGDEMSSPPGFTSKRVDDSSPDSEDREKQASVMSHGADVLAGQLESDELARAKSAKHHGDTLSENIHEYHYLVAKEFRTVMRHLNESPPRKYSYDEWAWFLKLMGEDESSATSHRAPHVKVDLSNAGEDDGKEDGSTEKPDLQNAQTDDGATAPEEKKQWSWMGNRSPLMGEMEEAEWVLQRLSMTLEKALKKHSEQAVGQKKDVGGTQSGERKSHSEVSGGGKVEKGGGRGDR